jgi:subtilase family serine protease
VAESNEANNQNTVTMAAQLYTLVGGDGGQPDLVVTSVTFDPAKPVKGQNFTAKYEIKNQGDVTSGPFTFRLHFHASAGVADCNWDGALSATEITWAECVRQINGNTGNYPVKATIDVESEIAESNESNNVLDTTLTLVAQ